MTVEAAHDGADAVTLTVLDEGPGIDEDEAEALFELFYRSPQVASTVAGRRASGCSSAASSCGAMGGTIRARRRPEGGAAFTVTLPRYADDESG